MRNGWNVNLVDLLLSVCVCVCYDFIKVTYRQPNDVLYLKNKSIFALLLVFQFRISTRKCQTRLSLFGSIRQGVRNLTNTSYFVYIYYTHNYVCVRTDQLPINRRGNIADVQLIIYNPPPLKTVVRGSGDALRW